MLSQAAPSMASPGTFTFDEHHNPVKQTAILCFDGATPVLKEMF